jgi:hypothetical protein
MIQMFYQFNLRLIALVRRLDSNAHITDHLELSAVLFSSKAGLEV